VTLALITLGGFAVVGVVVWAVGRYGPVERVTSSLGL
jgi:hypothetical protein